MTVAEYIVQTLVNFNVTDVFGVPGGVVLEFLYAADANKNISIHLSTNEQSAGYSALGYAQNSGTIGVAYATRGPGFTNLLTPMADAFFDSIPVLFITAHSKEYKKNKCRFSEEQEFDTVSLVRGITKKAIRVEDVRKIKSSLKILLRNALIKRPGSVFLDIKESVLQSEIDESLIEKKDIYINLLKETDNQLLKILEAEFEKAKRPIILFGNGIHQSKSENEAIQFAKKTNIPVVSSCIAQDLTKQKILCFGYIGSHGIRCANFILYHADLIISLGNRMAFDHNSDSFGSIAKKRIIRFDIDEQELKKAEKNEFLFKSDLKQLLGVLSNNLMIKNNKNKWINNCKRIKEIFSNYDKTHIINDITRILNKIPPKFSVVTDVGNNEFLISQSYFNSKISNRLLMSKSFAAMGSSIPKAIGVFYSTRNPVVSFVGDQAFLVSIQDLAFIDKNKIPIKIILLNNYSSGMIKSKQKSQKRAKFVHTTVENGYLSPEYKNIIKGFQIEYFDFYKLTDDEIKIIMNNKKACVIEIKINNENDPVFLPKGNLPWDFVPAIDNCAKIVEEIMKELK